MNFTRFGSILYIVLFVLLNFNSLQAQNKVSEIEPQIDKLFSFWDNINSPGASVAVMKDGEIVFSKGYGAANLEYDIPNTPSTIFHVASVSKQFTAFAILLLVEEGKLSLEDDIRKYIPEVPDFGHTITLRHLASHTSGMRDQWNLLSMAGWRMDDVITKEHVLTMVSRQKELNFLPGEEYYYCNTGFTLLAEVVARVSEMSFAEFTHERIFKPLKMENTLFYDDHQKVVKNRAYSYYLDQMKMKKSVLSYANVGATSLFTTAEDLCRWAMNLKHPKIGSKESITLMNTEAKLNNGSTFGGALGQFVSPYKGLHQIQHGGADAGYRSYIGRFPEQDFAVVVLSNHAWFNPNQKALEIADIYLKDHFVEEKQEQNRITEVVSKASTKALKAYEGFYWNDKGNYSRKIYLREDTLRYSRGNSESPLVPIGGNKFQMLNVEDKLIVEFIEENKMKVVVNDDDPIISKQYEPKEYATKELVEFTGTFYSEELGTSYQILLEEEELIIQHMRTGRATMKSLKEDFFNASAWYMGNIQFVRNEQGKIKGLTMTNGRVRNLRFEKQS